MGSPMQSNYVAVLLVASSYVLWIVATYVDWLPPRGPGLEMLLAVFVLWLLIVVAISVWHSWKVILVLPQFLDMSAVYTLVSFQPFCADVFQYCVP
jgi:hypothetical protein